MNQPEPNPIEVRPFASFRESVEAVLNVLHHHFGFRLWMFTRVENDDWIVLAAHDQGYGVRHGTVLRWSDSFCSRMVLGLGPPVATRAQDVPAYADAPINKDLTIGAYIGVPMYSTDGSLFGTLCAIDPHPHHDLLYQEFSLIKLQAQLLSTILHNDLEMQTQVRRCERAEVESQIDILTGVFNRRGWEKLLAVEEIRCQQFGHPAGVVLIDLDHLKQINDSQGHDAGDRLLKATAASIQQVVRAKDIVARLGGDEFGVLLLEIDANNLEAVVQRLQERLIQVGISASVGWAMRSPSEGLTEAVNAADKSMYLQKKSR
jgi:diguanylate cyclase (GGDEF)-like protein